MVGVDLPYNDKKKPYKEAGADHRLAEKRGHFRQMHEIKSFLNNLLNFRVFTDENFLLALLSIIGGTTLYQTFE